MSRDRNPDGRYAVTPAGFLVCQDCGSLVMEGYRVEHDDMHGGLNPRQITIRDNDGKLIGFGQETR